MKTWKICLQYMNYENMKMCFLLNMNYENRKISGCDTLIIKIEKKILLRYMHYENRTIFVCNTIIMKIGNCLLKIH